MSGAGFDWDNKNVVVKNRKRQAKEIRFIGTFRRIWDRVEKTQLGHRLREEVSR
jgi:hypothetical protein